MTSKTQSWGPFVILHADALDTIEEQERYTEPSCQDQQCMMPKPLRPRLRKDSVRCDHQDRHPEVDEDEEIIDMYATGWKATPNRRDPRKTMLETENSNAVGTCISTWDPDSSDSDTLRPSKRPWNKAVRACKGRLKQMRSKENLLGLSRKSSNSSLPLVRISSVSKLERHYGYTSPELQRIGIESGPPLGRVSERGDRKM